MLAFQTMIPTAPHLPSKIDHVSSPANISAYDDVHGMSPALLRDIPSSLAHPIPKTKPKLSLQTSSLPVTFSKSSTGLAVAAASIPIASPTVLNTFNNAHDIPHRLSPANSSPSGARMARPNSRLMSPYVASKATRPYKLPLGVRGILRNTPMPSSLRGASACTNSASPRTSRRVFFPVAKKVNYRNPLDEEIRTNKYTARHSDLSSEESEPDYRSDEASDVSEEGSRQSASEDDTNGDVQVRKRRKIKARRQVAAVAVRDRGKASEEQNSQRPRLRHGSRRRKRHWVWTVAPVTEVRISVEDDEPRFDDHVRPRKPALSLDTSSMTSLEASLVAMPAEETPYVYATQGDVFLSPSQTALPPSSSESSIPWSSQTEEDETKEKTDSNNTSEPV